MPSKKVILQVVVLSALTMALVYRVPQLRSAVVGA